MASRRFAVACSQIAQLGQAQDFRPRLFGAVKKGLTHMALLEVAQNKFALKHRRHAETITTLERSSLEFEA